MKVYTYSQAREKLADILEGRLAWSDPACELFYELFYLDQMFGLDVAEALRQEGHDTVRASETGHARADDRRILEFRKSSHLPL